MLFSMLASLLVLLTVLMTQCQGDVCDPSEMEKYFEETPDAWKLVQKFRFPFYLVYHSQNPGFDKKHNCLMAARSKITASSKSAKYAFYYITSKSTEEVGSVNVKAQKSDLAYENENMFVVENIPGRTSGQHRYQLLFSDYKSCAVLRSNLLGVQVWVTKVYLEKRNDVPFSCSLIYDLAADQNKTLSFDWKKCGIFKRTEL
uniref:Putative salivary lipocalin n=1 Tax=Ixodes ricinus TaxID=34613 RepID=A0A147BX79_IXORI